MTSLAIHHELMPMYTGQILAPENVQIPTETNVYRPESKMTNGKYGKIQDGLEASIGYVKHSKMSGLTVQNFNLARFTDGNLVLLQSASGGGALNGDFRPLI